MFKTMLAALCQFFYLPGVAVPFLSSSHGNGDRAELETCPAP